jgi:hypothetical protein
MNHPKISQTIEPESLELRKEIALSVAKECIQLLKENYAVTKMGLKPRPSRTALIFCDFISKT